MNNIQRLRELMAKMERANAAISGRFPSQQATLDYELQERLLTNAMLAIYPALLAVAEAAKDFDSAINQNREDVARKQIKDALQKLNEVKLI